MDLHVYISMGGLPTGIWALFLHSFIYWGNIGLKFCISFMCILYFDFYYSVLTSKTSVSILHYTLVTTGPFCLPQCSLWQLLYSLYLSVCYYFICCVHLFNDLYTHTHILYSTPEWNHMVFVFFHLSYFLPSYLLV